MGYMIKVLLIVFAFSAGVMGQEIISLKESIPSVNAYEPASLTIIMAPVVEVRVVLLHAGSGRTETFTYPCSAPCAMSTPDAVRKLIAALNTANLSTRSLFRRVMDRLLLDFPDRFPGGATVQ